MDHTEIIKETVNGISLRIGRPLYYYVGTFGCQMNARDSEKIRGMLSSFGYIPCESEEGSEELSYVSGHSFDVDGFVLDECYVQLPMNVLCSEDCKGLCIKCGKNLNEGSCNCDTFVPDPRMTRILDIYNANKEEV